MRHLTHTPKTQVQSTQWHRGIRSSKIYAVGFLGPTARSRVDAICRWRGCSRCSTKTAFIEDCLRACGQGNPTRAGRERAYRQGSLRFREVARAFGEPQAGLVDVLYRGDDINILHVAWAPLMTLLPHDHLMWVAIGIYGGREENVFYRRGENGLIQLRGMQLETRDAALFGATAIHSAANPLDRVTGTIHVYGGDFIGSATARGTVRTPKACRSGRSTEKPPCGHSTRPTSGSPTTSRFGSHQWMGRGATCRRRQNGASGHLRSAA